MFSSVNDSIQTKVLIFIMCVNFDIILTLINSLGMKSSNHILHKHDDYYTYLKFVMKPHLPLGTRCFLLGISITSLVDQNPSSFLKESPVVSIIRILG